MSLLIVVPCHAGDQDQALRLLNWIAELGRVQANAMLFCSSECNVEQLMQAGQLAFTSIKHELDAENVKCNWQSNDPGSRDPSGPNSVFRQVVWSIYLSGKRDPWLFLEPDSVPLSRDWYEVLVADYKNCGKIVMGDLVSTNSPHLSGVAVYPHNVPEVFSGMVHQVKGAFDTSDAKRVLSAAHITPRIMDRWRSPEFKTDDDFRKIRPEAVLFHADKSGSLIPILRQKLGINAGVTVNLVTVTEPGRAVVENLQVDPKGQLPSGGSNPPTSTVPVVDIYLKTYPKDYELANYCLKSIAKFVTGYRAVLIECPDWNGFPIELPCETALFVGDQPDRQPGYIDQQAKKLAAFKHTDADYLLYVDSDCCFQRPFDVAEMFKDGKSTWQYTPFSEAREDQRSAWIGVMQKFLGKLPQHEFMRRHPHILPRWLPEEMDKFCRYRHGKTLDEYIMAQGDPAKPLQLSFSEFNCAGFFAWEFFHDRILWVTDAEATPDPLVQGFTHAGPERIKADIERAKDILGEDQPREVMKFQNRDSSLEKLEIDNALVTIREEARKSPLHKARLWKRITAALGMERPVQGPKRRRGRPAKLSPKSTPKKGTVSPRPDTNVSRPSVKGGSGSNAPQGGSLISA